MRRHSPRTAKKLQAARRQAAARARAQGSSRAQGSTVSPRTPRSGRPASRAAAAGANPPGVRQLSPRAGVATGATAGGGARGPARTSQPRAATSAPVTPRGAATTRKLHTQALWTGNSPPSPQPLVSASRAAVSAAREPVDPEVTLRMPRRATSPRSAPVAPPPPRVASRTGTLAHPPSVPVSGRRDDLAKSLPTTSAAHDAHDDGTSDDTNARGSAGGSGAGGAPEHGPRSAVARLQGARSFRVLVGTRLVARRWRHRASTRVAVRNLGRFVPNAVLQRCLARAKLRERHLPAAISASVDNLAVRGCHTSLPAMHQVHTRAHTAAKLCTQGVAFIADVSGFSRLADDLAKGGENLSVDEVRARTPKVSQLQHHHHDPPAHRHGYCTGSGVTQVLV